jgi:ankyrin repeat protein
VHPAPSDALVTVGTHCALLLQYLIKCGVDLDAADGNGVRPLHLAAITNRLDIVKQLIDKGANPTKQDNEGDVPL